MLNEIDSTIDFRNAIGASQIVLVDFYADWCEPCKWLAVILEELELVLPPDSEIVLVDSEKFPALVQEWSIKSIPVLILFKNGEEVWRMNGFLTKDELLNLIHSFL
jgi:thioredoxin 1